jgi:ABC-2 type transport system ATP-binding protein
VVTDNNNHPAIRIEGLNKHYGDVHAVRDLDLIVPTGSIFGFLGRNGAGKTTTIRLVTGLARPDSGRAWIGGVETTNFDSRAQSGFGYLPQEPAFYGWMTTAEYLDYTARLFQMGQPARRERVAELLELVDLANVARRKIGGFSGGMKQRLGLAQALLHQPPVIILDEPMAGLDPAGRRDVLNLLDRLRKTTTVFFSTHILADVERVCDKVGIVHEGRLIEVADREELLSRFTTDVAVLQVRPEVAEQLRPLADDLQTQPWVNSINLEGPVIRVNAADIDAGQLLLLPLVVKHNIPLLKFEWVRPNLEEIFLNLSVEGGK